MSTNKNLSLEGLRGLACLAVFSCHFLYVMFPYLARGRSPDQSPFLAKWPWETWLVTPPLTILYNGDFAVLVFFVISGYVLMGKFCATGDRTFLVDGALKRYPRLFIPAAASVGIALLLMRLGFMHTQSFPDYSMAGWIKDLYTQIPSLRSALFAGFVGVPFIGDAAALSWNGPLWTLRIELFGSLLLFFTYFIFGKKKPVTIIFFIAISFATDMPLYFLPFLAGALLNEVTQWLRKHSQLSFLFFIIGLICGSFDYTSKFQFMARIVPIGIEKPTFWYAIGAVFTVAGVLGSIPLTRFFGSKVNAYFGKISFSFYLLHWPVIFSFSIWAVEKLMGLGVSFLSAAWCSYMFSFVALIILAEIFTEVIERPATQFASVASAWIRSSSEKIRYRLVA